MTTLLRQLSELKSNQNKLQKKLAKIDKEITQIQFNLEALNQIESQINNSTENKEYYLNLLSEAKNSNYEALEALFVDFGYKTILQNWEKTTKNY